MTYPILEYDSTRKAFIDPAQVIKPLNMPEHVVVCFFREVIANEEGVRALVKTMSGHGIPYRQGKSWTTDAPYRETPNKIAMRRKEGCLVVEMEAAGMMAVAQFRDVVFGQVLYGGDNLSGVEWDERGWRSRSEIREGLFWLCAEACLAI